MMDRTCYVILGMRSGSSLLAGIVNKLGVFMSGPLMRPAFDNKKGFFELRELTDMNSKAVDWTKPGLIHGRAPWLANAIENLINKHFRNIETFAIKDPRVTRLWDYYSSVFSEMGIKTKVLIARRRHLDVAASVHKNRDLPVDVAMRIAQDYEDLYNQIQRTHRPTMNVFYDDLVNYPYRVVPQIAQFVGKSRMVNKEVYEFIDPSLNHQGE